MKRCVRAAVAAAGLILVAGCGPDNGGKSHTSTSATAASTAAVSADLCTPGKAALPDVSAVRARYPKVTDDQAAYAISLLPAGLVTSAGITSVESGTPSTKIMTSIKGSTLTVRAGTSVAPAEIAASIAFNLTAKVLAESSRKDPVLVDLRIIVQGTASVTADTYVRLAQSRPQATHGDRAPGEGIPDLAKKRLAYDSSRMLTGVNEAAFAARPGYWTALAGFMGARYYRPSTIPGALDMDAPVVRADRAKLSDALAPCH